jgi:hypothetical protein
MYTVYNDLHTTYLYSPAYAMLFIITLSDDGDDIFKFEIIHKEKALLIAVTL